MKISISIFLILLGNQLFGQKGYVKIDNDSTMYGFLRYYVSAKDGHEGYELWRTKTDKNPRKIPIQLIREYAIKDDTFKILHQFKPFNDDRLYFEMVDAKIESKGKVNLYSIDNYRRVYMVTYSSSPVIPINNIEYLKETIYILEDSKINYLIALPREGGKLLETLGEFFTEKYLTKYGEVNGKIKYKTVPDLVKLYNSK